MFQINLSVKMAGEMLYFEKKLKAIPVKIPMMMMIGEEILVNWSKR